jgi:radical SAM protein with 4Fe4S-binding SPASM domain
MNGDCSIRTTGHGFTADDIAACAVRAGLLSIEIELTPRHCNCPACEIDRQEMLSPDEMLQLLDDAIAIGSRRCIIVDHDRAPQADHLMRTATARGMQVERISRDEHLLADGRRGLPLRVDHSNVDDIAIAWRAARAQGSDPLVQMLMPSSNVSPLRAKQLFKDLARVDREEFSREWLSPSETIGRSCKRHLFSCHVAACGTVYPCVGVTIPLGNIRTEPLARILNDSEVLENLRDFQHKVKEPCQSCCKSTDCYGCRGAAYQLTGDYLAGDEMCWKAEDVDIPRLPITINGLIPHGPSIRMINDLVQLGERRATTRFTITADSPFVDEAGRFDETGYIEMIAQSFAASHGFQLSTTERSMHRGLLLGIKDVTVHADAYLGDTLSITVRKVTRFGDFGIVEGEVRNQHNTLLAAGTIKVWRPSGDSPQQFPS